jgi:hypothetical protein
MFSLWVASGSLKDYTCVIYSLPGETGSPKERRGAATPRPSQGSSQRLLVVLFVAGILGAVISVPISGVVGVVALLLCPYR